MTTLVDGMFYIDNVTGGFYLREGGVWNLKGFFGGGGGGEGSNIFTDFGPPPSGGVIGQEILVGSGPPL